jgi:hypothetical protein
MIVKSPIELFEFSAKNNILLTHCPDKRECAVEIQFSERTFGKGEWAAVRRATTLELVSLNVLFSNSNEIYSDYKHEWVIGIPRFEGSRGLDHVVGSNDSHYANMIFVDCIINVAEKNELHIYDTIFKNCKILLHPFTKFKRCSFENVEFCPITDSIQSFCIHNFDKCRFENITSNNILLNFGLIGYRVNDKEKPENTRYTLSSYANFSYIAKKIVKTFITTLSDSRGGYNGVVTTVFGSGEASLCHGTVILHVKNYTGKYNYYLARHAFHLANNIYYFRSSDNLGLKNSQFVIDESDILEAFSDEKYDRGGYCIDYLNDKDKPSEAYLSELDSLPILIAVKNGTRDVLLNPPKRVVEEPVRYACCC